MHIIKTICDVRRLQLAGAISPELAEHFARKMSRLKEALEPEIDLEEFNLEFHGVFGVLEASDQDMTAIHLPKNLAHIMPEWVSRLEVAGEIFYVLYVLVSNDEVIQVYLPDTIMADKIRLWLSEQPAEEEGDDYGDESELSQPF
jgi:hypothetical protein